MKKSLMVFLFCLTSSIANAQSNTEFKEFNKTILCGPFETLLKNLKDDDIAEMPIWAGNDESQKSQWALFVNRKTRTFTVVQFTDSVACVIGTGTKSYELTTPVTMN